ncbi:MAG: hypothetical protein J3Q66DRAFT_397823 [Benniella sp.]|nr:MAG: hypothetical protein J3Q66DRAFT_397823 [Benniella sp.]
MECGNGKLPLHLGWTRQWRFVGCLFAKRWSHCFWRNGDFASGTSARTLTGHSGSVVSVVYSPNDIADCLSQAKTARLQTPIDPFANFPESSIQVETGAPSDLREISVHLRPRAWVSLHAGGWRDAPHELEGFVRLEKLMKRLRAWPRKLHPTEASTGFNNLSSGTAVDLREMPVHLRPRAWVSLHVRGWRYPPRELEGFVRLDDQSGQRLMEEVP